MNEEKKKLTPEDETLTEECTCESEGLSEETEDAAEAENNAASDDKNAEGEEKDAEAKSEEDEAWQSKYMRLMADFQNFKRRTEKEKTDLYSYANEKIVSDLLVVIDNFERALSVETADEKFLEGMQMIHKQFFDVLVKAGLEEIEAEGIDFDPNFHNAVMTEDNPDFESGKVTAVLQKGYMLNKKVIRPSMVKVNN